MHSGREAVTRRVRKPRGQGLRTRTGCLTCRRRHVKCDEAKPDCLACIKVKQICSYVPEGGSSQTSSVDVTTIGIPLAASTQDHHTQGSGDDKLPESEYTSYNSPPTPPWRPSSPSNSQYVDVGTVIRESSTSEATREKSNSIGFNALPQESRLMQDVAPSPLTPLESWTIGSVSSAGNVESDTAGWFDLLFRDAVLGNSSLPDIDFEAEGLDIFGNSIPHTPSHIPQDETSEREGNLHTSKPPTQTSNSSLLERVPRLGRDQVFEKQSWHSSDPIKLLGEEQFLFQHFVRHISQWVDFLDPRAPFSTFVPHLAIHNVGLMNAILALSIRHLSLTTGSGAYEARFYGDAIQYYYKTLHYIQKAMQYDTYKTSLELLSTALILSTYEMLDGSSTDWERHLKGVFWIQRSQVIHGDSKGLRSAVWWAWLCQDVWAAFREKRKPFTFWKPVRTFETLDPHELASRSVYLFAQVVGYCSKEAIEEEGDDLTARMTKAGALHEKLEEWRKFLTIEFEPMPLHKQVSSPQYHVQDAFEPVWIHPPAFAVAVQLYHCSKILLLLHQPIVGGVELYMRRRSTLTRSINMICGLALTLTDYGSSIMCAQSLYIAGMVLEDQKKREVVFDMLKGLRKRTGWPVQPLEEELALAWKLSGQPG